MLHAMRSLDWAISWSACAGAPYARTASRCGAEPLPGAGGCAATRSSSSCPVRLSFSSSCRVATSSASRCARSISCAGGPQAYWQLDLLMCAPLMCQIAV